jgi:hypothetical protein
MAYSFLNTPSFLRLKQLPRSFYLRKELFRAIGSKQEHEASNKTIIGLYDAYNIDSCLWPQNAEGQYAQKFLTPLIKRGVSTYIENVQTDMRALVWDQLVLPITVNEAEYDNSYVCSPYSYYISYAKQSLGLVSQAWLHSLINGLLSGVGKLLCHYQVNKVVVVNNWLTSTNLYPPLQAQQLTAIAQFLQQKFPDYAIVFRSVDPFMNPICYEVLQQIGFDYIANRQIFFIDPQHSTLFESRLFKSDRKLLKNSDYEVIDGEQLTEKDLPRLLSLYRDVYIEKYSDLNPNFNENFLRLLLAQKLMRFKALKKEGRIDGVVGYIQRNGIMQCPFFGYDRSLPQEIALYRLLSTVLMLEAQAQGLVFHQSSGASMFKKIRKANSCIEYMAVYYQHLKIKHQLPWQILKSIYNSLGMMYMKHY